MIKQHLKNEKASSLNRLVTKMCAHDTSGGIYIDRRFVVDIFSNLWRGFLVSQAMFQAFSATSRLVRMILQIALDIRWYVRLTRNEHFFDLNHDEK